MTGLCSGSGLDAVPGMHSLGMMSQSSTSGHRGRERTSVVMFLVMTYYSHMLGPKGEVQRSSGVNMVIVDWIPVLKDKSLI